MLKRVDQQVAFVTQALKSERFTFETDETYSPDRKKAARPADLEEAKTLWRARLRFEYLQEKLNKAKPEEIVNTITRRYLRIAKSLRQYDNEEILQLFLTSLAHAYDPHSDYLGRAMFEDFGINMKLSLFGIGALLESDDGYCKIRDLTPGGPAIRSSQLRPGDRIVAVGQADNPPVDVVDMKLNKIVEMIRGPKGTVVSLTVIPAGAADPSTRKVVKLTRDEIKLEEQEAKARIIDLPAQKGQPQRLAVIDLPSFYESGGNGGGPRKSASEDVARLLKKLQEVGVDGLILDLRRNGGGSLQEAIKLSGLFIKDGPIVQVRDSEGRRQIDRDLDAKIHYAGPMVVLTSRMSASASEILAGALQDYDRAVIVGESSTHGKGTVQSLVQLAPLMRARYPTQKDPGALKVTIQKFYRASGASTQLKGVVPDIVLPSLSSHLEVGEASLDNALEWDTINPADYVPLGLVNAHLGELKQRSEARQASDPDFRFLRQEIDRLSKAQREKTVSLSEARRTREKQETRERFAARARELKARKAPEGKTIQLSLREASLPGLPPATPALGLGGRPVPPAGSTAAVRAGVGDAAEDEEDEVIRGTPEPDVLLDEARRVLLDLISLAMK
jgi:carboxyl-terminal processing protease